MTIVTKRWPISCPTPPRNSNIWILLDVMAISYSVAHPGNDRRDQNTDRWADTISGQSVYWSTTCMTSENARAVDQSRGAFSMSAQGGQRLPSSRNPVWWNTNVIIEYKIKPLVCINIRYLNREAGARLTSERLTSVAQRLSPRLYFQNTKLYHQKVRIHSKYSQTRCLQKPKRKKLWKSTSTA